MSKYNIPFFFFLFSISSNLFSQNIGIGTANPLEKLHVVGTLRADDLAINTAATATSRLLYVDENGKLYAMPTGMLGDFLSLDATGIPVWLAPNNSNNLAENGLYYSSFANRVHLGGNLIENTMLSQGNFTFRHNLNGTGDVEVGSTTGVGLYVHHSNQVGIGTSLPRGVFDISSNGDIYLVNNTLVGTSQSVYFPGHIFIAPFNATDISYLEARRSNSSGTTALRLRTFDTAALNEAMQIEGNGNVGMGITAPNTKLDINGALAVRSTLVNLTGGTAANPEIITVADRSYIRIGSSSSDLTQNVFSLSDGLQEGQMLIIEYANNDANLATLFDMSLSNSNADLTSQAIVFGQSNVYTRLIRLIWNGVDWLQEGVGLPAGKAIFTHTNTIQTWTVPPGVFTINIKMWGAGGGAKADTNSIIFGVISNVFRSSGGGGGYVSGTLAVTPGEALNIIVGSGGGNGYIGGGGSTSLKPTFLIGLAFINAGRGGGRSAIQKNGIDLVTAGGGGGAGEDDDCSNGNVTCAAPNIAICRNGYGGAGGGLSGGSGGGGDKQGPPTCALNGDRGNGGGQLFGEPASSSGSGGWGGTGLQFQGGKGGDDTGCNNTLLGGGGGGGWYGGSGGSTSCNVPGPDDAGGGGGGGSSYVANLVGNVVNNQGYINTTGGWANPGDISDPDYQAGIGRGGAAGNFGGNGLIVISW